MNKKSKLIPQLRFPEFEHEGEWVSEVFDKMYSFLVTNSFSRDCLNYKNGTIKNIHYGDIHTKFSALFDITKERVPFINPDIPIDRIRKECYCLEGDMIFADASEDLNDVGKSIEIVNLNNEKLVSGLHTLMARQIEPKLTVGFGGYLFLSDSIRKQIQREAQGAKILGISGTRISNITIFYPLNLQEQQRIAACLSSLDELITAHKAKLQALKEHKKGLMQNLFPQAGEKVPKLRFPEFENEGEWIFEKFNKVYSFLVTNSFSRDCLNYENGTVKNIHYGDIHTKFSTLFDIAKESVPFINPDIPIDRIRQECYCLEGDMIFADASEDLNDVGKSIEIVNLNNEKIVSGLHTLMARQIEPKLTVGFGGYLFLSDSIRKQIQREAQGAKVLGISGTRISNIKISFPINPLEQQRIAACLSSLDELIAAQVEKIEQLQQHKKGLMQGLFPKMA